MFSAPIRDPFLKPHFFELPLWNPSEMHLYELHARQATFLRMIDCLDPSSIGSRNYGAYARFKAMLIILAHEMFTAKHAWLAEEVKAYDTFVTFKKNQLSANLEKLLNEHLALLSSKSLKEKKTMIMHLCTDPIKNFIESIIKYVKLKEEVSPGSLAFTSSINNTTAKQFTEMFAENLSRKFYDFQTDKNTVNQQLEFAWHKYCENSPIVNFRMLIEDEIKAFDFSRLDDLTKFTTLEYNLLCDKYGLRNNREQIIKLSKKYINYNIKFRDLLNKTLINLNASMPEVTAMKLSKVYHKAFEQALVYPAEFLKNFLCELYLLQLRVSADVNPAFLKCFKENYLSKLNDYLVFSAKDNSPPVTLKHIIAKLSENCEHHYVINSLEALVYESYNKLHAFRSDTKIFIGVKAMLVPFEEILNSIDDEKEEETTDEELESKTKEVYHSPVVEMNFAQTSSFLSGFKINPKLFSPDFVAGVIDPSCLINFNKEVVLIRAFAKSFNISKSLFKTQNDVREQAKDTFNILLGRAESIEEVSALLVVAEPVINVHQSTMHLFKNDTDSWVKLWVDANNKALNLLSSKFLSSTLTPSSLRYEIQYYKHKAIFNPMSTFGYVIDDQLKRFNRIVNSNFPRRLTR